MWGPAVLKDREFHETAPVQIGSSFDRLLMSKTAAKADGTVWFWGDPKMVYSAPVGGSSRLVGPVARRHPADTMQEMLAIKRYQLVYSFP